MQLRSSEESLIINNKVEVLHDEHGVKRLSMFYEMELGMM